MGAETVKAMRALEVDKRVVDKGRADKVDTIDEEETVEIKAEVEKDKTIAKAAEATTIAKEKKEEKICVMEVIVDTVAATNTSSMTDEAKVEIVETP
ncbi:unnamed protein product [Peronospora destructor]|uniref:Uncharacterized protein n=1 Tax=Peronospora destructor TaxID=86335 RepID=A0AAV0UT03_9STRA|nr:unnamed protein product [Peronospora destructor]